ncbi:MAG TPA: MlaD family protein, partial [Rhodanobacteraceae bacterium]|nr:MlaD family protein [Rhodanobacteraceae bacterium]
FLVVFSVAGVLIFLWLSSAPGEPRAYRIITDESVGGLAPQTEVQFKGLEVGHVTRVRFDPRDRSRVIVDFRVRRDTYVTRATYAVVSMQGLTGGKTLELKLGEGSRAPLATSDEHPALIPLRKGLLDQLEESAQQDMADLHVILASTKQLLDANNRAHLSASIRQLDAATAKLDQIEAQLLPAAARMPALFKSAQQSLDQSHALLANANRIAQDAREPVRKAGQVEDTLQHLGNRLDKQTAPDIEALSASLTRTSRLLEQLIRELKAKPQSLIFGPPQPPPGPGEPGFHDNGKKDNGHG